MSRGIKLNRKYNNALDVLWVIEKDKPLATTQKIFDLTPQFVLRLNNDRGLLGTYEKRKSKEWSVEFPAHFSVVKMYQWLLSDIQGIANIKLVIDPSTNRLAYDWYQKTKSLNTLPYNPEIISGIPWFFGW